MNLVICSTKAKVALRNFIQKEIISTDKGRGYRSCELFEAFKLFAGNSISVESEILTVPEYTVKDFGKDFRRLTGCEYKKFLHSGFALRVDFERDQNFESLIIDLLPKKFRVDPNAPQLMSGEIQKHLGLYDKTTPVSFSKLLRKHLPDGVSYSKGYFYGLSTLSKPFVSEDEVRSYIQKNLKISPVEDQTKLTEELYIDCKRFYPDREFPSQKAFSRFFRRCISDIYPDAKYYGRYYKNVYFVSERFKSEIKAIDVKAVHKLFEQYLIFFKNNVGHLDFDNTYHFIKNRYSGDKNFPDRNDFKRILRGYSKELNMTLKISKDFLRNVKIRIE